MAQNNHQNDQATITSQFKHTAAEMGADLKRLLSDEIESYNKREKRRSAEMMSIFAAHDYYANGFTPEEMRTTLEDLGPTYVKIGQIMSSRVDILPESYCKELEKLRQNVKPLDPEIARAVIEQETGRKIDEIFSEFRDEPLGSASVGQAHYAVLKDGTKVVTKVQRPLIADMMRKDFVLLKKFANLMNIVAEDDGGDQVLDLMTAIEELEKVTNEELDFRVEAENTKFFKENCIEDEDKISCPTVIDELTTERLFTMTFVDGYSVSKKERMIEDGYDVMEITQTIIENYAHQILDVGTFHADPHQGNIMVSGGKPYWIDFGMIGRITDSDIDLISSMVVSLLKGDTEELVDAIMSMGATSPETNRDNLIEDAQKFFDKYANVTGIADVDMTTVFNEVMDLANTHHITMPGRFTMLARSIMTIEGVIEELCPELNLLDLVSKKMAEHLKNKFNLKQEIVNKGRELLDAGKKTVKIPLLAYQLLDKAARDKLKVNMELTGTEEPLKKIGDFTKYIVLAIFACVMFLGCCILSMTSLAPLLPNGMPLLAVIGLVVSVSLGIFVVKKLWRR